MKAAAARRQSRVSVVGHPLPARDSIEARTFARDIIYSEVFEVRDADRPVWLAARARARRDILWLCRNVLGLTRLSEEIHRPAANFVMGIITAPKYGFGNLRDPRGNGKTSLATRGGAIWTILQDPVECIERGWAILGRESRIGINTLKAEMTEAVMLMLLDDLELADLRSLFPEIYPPVPRRWGQRAIELRRGLPREISDHPLFASYPRMTRFLDATFSPGSLESGRAGAHTHGEFVDDPVNEKTWNSATNIRTAVHGIDQLFNIIRPERGFRLITGNDWCPDDVNAQLDEKSNWHVFMRSATACETCQDGYPIDQGGKVAKQPNGRPAHQHTGKTWAHLMPESDGSPPDLGRIKQECGSIHIYMAQYENDPTAPEATYWSSERLARFEIIEYKGSRVLDLNTLVKFPDPAASRTSREEQFQVCRVRDLERTLAFDPSHGGAGLDVSEAAITVLGRTPADNFCWLSALASQDDPLSMLGTLVEEVIKWRIHRIAVESVGYQRVIGGLLRREFEARGINWLDWENDIVLVPITRAEGEKKTRIREALNPLINSRALLVNPAMPGYNAAMLQLEGFPIRRPWDTLDSLFMHQYLWDRVPLSVKRKREIQLAEMMRRRNRKRNMGTAYGWH